MPAMRSIVRIAGESTSLSSSRRKIEWLSEIIQLFSLLEVNNLFLNIVNRVIAFFGFAQPGVIQILLAIDIFETARVIL